MLENIRKELKNLSNEELAKNYKRYLKSPYEFYGLRVPQLRQIAKKIVKLNNLSISASKELFDELYFSNNHEEMNLAIFLIQNYKKQFDWDLWRFLTREKVLEKLKTWDHVDALGTGILGYISSEDSRLNMDIKHFSISSSPWIRRLSIITQLPSIKKGKLQLTILLAEKLCYDENIYVQKGCGWMLREAAKKNLIQIKEFINIHINMKPVCLSYATEKMPDFKKALKEKRKQDKEQIKKRENHSDLDKIKYFKN